MSLFIAPISFEEARAFVARHHRHSNSPAGHKFSVSLRDGEEVVGVAMAKNPVARHFEDGFTLEVIRSCTLGTPNGNSMLYGACRRVAFGMGYRRLITYTQADETGASLRAAGFIRLKELPASTNWTVGRQRVWPWQRQPDLFPVRKETGGIERVLWEVRGNAPPQAQPVAAA